MSTEVGDPIAHFLDPPCTRAFQSGVADKLVGGLDAITIDGKTSIPIGFIMDATAIFFKIPDQLANLFFGLLRFEQNYGRVENWRASFRVGWAFQLHDFRRRRKSLSHDRVSSPRHIEPDVQFSRIRLSDKVSRLRTQEVAPHFAQRDQAQLLMQVSVRLTCLPIASWFVLSAQPLTEPMLGVLFNRYTTSPSPHAAQSDPHESLVAATTHHRMGLPVLRRSSLYIVAVTTTPVELVVGSRSFTTNSDLPPAPESRLPHWHFRGLLSVHSRYGLHARQVT